MGVLLSHSEKHKKEIKLQFKMPLRRSESTKTSFSVYITRKTKYQRWLGMANVLTLLGSLSLIFFAIVLKLTYFMDQLGFISYAFGILPWILLSTGFGTFILSSVGFIFSSTERRPLILTYAYLTSILVLLQIVAVFFATEARREIYAGSFTINSVSALEDYNESEAVRAKWDYLQRRLRCCGAQSYIDYNNIASQYYTCVPDTCCFDYGHEAVTTSCTASLVSSRDGRSCTQESRIVQEIYTRGCLRILEHMYKQDLTALLLIFAISGTFLALIELVAVSLAFAFAAQINRRLKRENLEWQPGEDLSRGQGGHHTNVPMDDFPQ